MFLFVILRLGEDLLEEGGHTLLVGSLWHGQLNLVETISATSFIIGEESNSLGLAESALIFMRCSYRCSIL